MKNFFKKLLSPTLGKKKLQGFFELLHLFSLKGMNVGRGGDVSGSGEKWVLSFAGKNLPPQQKGIIFDVGANVGNYSLISAQVFKDLHRQIDIYAFEPALETYNLLKQKVEAFSQIKPINYALGDKEGEAILYTNFKASGLASLYNRKLNTGNSMNLSERVKIDTIDNFCRQNGINHIHLLKLDVEGNELNVLKGANGMLSKDAIDFIQFEFGGTDIDARVFLRDFYELLGQKYNISRILANGLRPLVAYNELYEIFLPTNFLAIRKGVTGA